MAGNAPFPSYAPAPTPVRPPDGVMRFEDDGRSPTVTVRNVPLFRTHSDRGYNCDQQWLDDCVQNFQADKAESALIAGPEHSYLPTVYIGHTSPNPSDTPPPAFAAVDNLRRYGDWLWGDMVHVPREFNFGDGRVLPYADVLRQWRMRSAEVLPNKRRLAGVALLGHAPHFATPAMRYSSVESMVIGGETVVRYTIFGDGDDMPETTPNPAAATAPQAGGLNLDELAKALLPKMQTLLATAAANRPENAAGPGAYGTDKGVPPTGVPPMTPPAQPKPPAAPSPAPGGAPPAAPAHPPAPQHSQPAPAPAHAPAPAGAQPPHPPPATPDRHQEPPMPNPATPAAAQQPHQCPTCGKPAGEQPQRYSADDVQRYVADEVRKVAKPLEDQIAALQEANDGMLGMVETSQRRAREVAVRGSVLEAAQNYAVPPKAIERIVADCLSLETADEIKERIAEIKETYPAITDMQQGARQRYKAADLVKAPGGEGPVRDRAEENMYKAAGIDKETARLMDLLIA